MTFHTLHSDLSREEVKTLVCMTHVAKCPEKDIHWLKSVWPPCNPLYFVFVSPVSSSLAWPLSTQCRPCSQLTYGPAVFHPAVWDMDGAGNPKEEMSEATLNIAPLLLFP